MNHDDTQKLHLQAEHLREQEKFEEAILRYNQVVQEYQKTGDHIGEVEAIGGKTLVYKHLYLRFKKAEYLKIAMNLCLESIKIANTHHLDSIFQKLYFRLGEIQVIAGTIDKAVESYKKSLSSWIDEDAEKGHVTYHLGEAEWQIGEKEKGLSHIREGVSMIERHGYKIDSFLFNVWQSGGYMTLAKVLKDENPIDSKDYLAKAKKIIESDPRLVIRRRQLQNLEEKLFINNKSNV